MLCEEKERQQEKLCRMKREILLKEREQKLHEALDKQVGFSTTYASPVFKQAHLRRGPLSRGDFSAALACWGTILCILNKINIYFQLWHAVLSGNLTNASVTYLAVPCGQAGRRSQSYWARGSRSAPAARADYSWCTGDASGLKPCEHPAVTRLQFWPELRWEVTVCHSLFDCFCVRQWLCWPGCLKANFWWSSW